MASEVIPITEALEFILRGVTLAVNEIVIPLELVFIVLGEETMAVRALVTPEVDM